MLSEVKYYFRGLSSKLGKYCEESIEFINSNDKWNDQLTNLFFNLDSNSKDVQNCFKFLNNIKTQKLFSHGQKILDNFSEMQQLLNVKVKECVDSLSIHFLEITDNFFEIDKKEVIFTNDIRKKLKMFNSSTSSLKSDHNLLHNVNIHEMKIGSGPLDEDCFLDNNMDQLSSNLMSSLNLLNEKVMKNEFDFSSKDQKSVGKPALMTHQVNNRYVLNEIPLNINFNTSHGEISDQYRDQVFQKQNILSSVNIDIDQKCRKPKRTKTTKSNKNFKIKPRHKKSQGKSKTLYN